MFKVKIEQELEASKKKKLEELVTYDPLNQIKLIEQGAAADDLRILEAIGENHTLIQAKEKYGKQLEFNKIEEEYNGRVFSRAEIKALAVKYHLRFLSSRLFCGEIPVDITARIREFSKDTNSAIDDYSIARKFFILAPASSFDLKSQKVKRPDPLMFYEIDSEHYRLIHKWGVDFTILRLLLGFRWKSYWHKVLFDFSVALPTVSFLLALVFTRTYYLDPVWFAFGAFIFSVGVALSASMGMYSDTGGENSGNGFFSPANWNQAIKLKT